MPIAKWNRRYFYFQLISWTVYFIIGMSFSYAFEPMGWKNVAFQLSATLTMFSATHFFRYAIKKLGWLEKTLLQVFMLLFVWQVVMALIVNAFNTFFGIFVLQMITVQQFSITIYFVYSFQSFMFLSLWTAVYVGSEYFRNYKRQEIEKWQLQAAVKDAELIALKAQINPHFLFNALNNIRGLILEDQMKARGMVDNLAELLRYSIQFNNSEKVTLREELEVVEKYLELESIHYEDRLKYELDVGKHLGEAKVPPMIIQLMAENAIKHGISLEKKGGKIDISIRKEEDELAISVQNTGQLLDTESSGIGIRNAIERIRILFTQMPAFTLNQQGEKVVATLKFPYQE